MSAPTAAAATTAQLRISTSATRSNSQTLSTGATVTGKVYIFAPNGTDTKSVDFYLDGSLVRHEGVAPYDFAGTANNNTSSSDPAIPWDSSKVSNGSHTIKETTFYTDGSSVTSSATVTISNGTVTPPPSSDPPACGSLQTLINNAASGSTLNVPACTFREAVTISKPLTLTTSGAVIKGSDVWTGWSQNGSTWVSTNAVPSLPTNTGCASGTSACGRSEQVYVDGKPLTEIAYNSTPSSTQFSLDGSRRVVIATNPSGRKMEVTTRQRWITVASGSVTIRGFVMTHVAPAAQRGGIDAINQSNVTVDSVRVSYSHAALVSFDGGTNIQVLNSDLSNGGQTGFHVANITNSRIAGNHIYNNNTLNYDHGGEGGGGKMSGTTGLVVDNNEIDHNNGRGLWGDPNNSQATISNNRLHDNYNEGLLWEISDSVKVFGNKVWMNGWNDHAWVYGGGIVIASSANAEVYNNTVAWNARQIIVLSQNRGSGGKFSWLPRNEYVHDNVIAGTDDPTDTNFRYALGFVQDWSGGMYDASSNNRGANNRFWYGTPEGPTRFGGWKAWNSLTFFNTTPGGGGNSSYISTSTKDSLLSAAGMPTTQPAHP